MMEEERRRLQLLVVREGHHHLRPLVMKEQRCSLQLLVEDFQECRSLGGKALPQVED